VRTIIALTTLLALVTIPPTSAVLAAEATEDPASALFDPQPQSNFIETIAANSDDVAHADRIAQLEARIALLESGYGQQCGTTDSDVMGSLDRALCRQAVGSGGLFAGAEVSWLRPRLSGSTPAFAAANGGRLIDNSFDTAIRYNIGYRGDNGVGVRGQYWQFDHAYDFLPPFGPAKLSIQAQAADFELTLDQRLRNWNLQVSSGIRYGQLRYFSDAAGAFGVGEASFEGIGPTVAIAADRKLGDSGFALYGNLRGAIMWGEMRNASMLLNMPRGPIRDENARTVENQLGVSWSTRMGESGTFQVRTAWETQVWMNDTFADDVYGIGSNLGLMGPTLAAEFRY
jgi:Legionella pneumophila major outer membrane protein precursor